MKHKIAKNFDELMGQIAQRMNREAEKPKKAKPAAKAKKPKKGKP